MGCSCTRENALKVVTANKLVPEKTDNNMINNSYLSNNNYGTTKNPSSYHNNVSLSRIDKIIKDYFTLIIVFSKNEKRELQISLENKQEYITLIQLLNKALFESNEFDINFVTIFDKEEDEYEYIIQRINNKEADESLHSYSNFLEKNNNNNEGKKKNSSDFESDNDTPKKKKRQLSESSEDEGSLSENRPINSRRKFHIWNIYINNKIENFSLLCQENRIVHKEEIIELKYESY